MKDDTLVDMVDHMTDDVGLIHQMPFVCDRPGFPATLEKVKKQHELFSKWTKNNSIFFYFNCRFISAQLTLESIWQPISCASIAPPECRRWCGRSWSTRPAAWKRSAVIWPKTFSWPRPSKIKAIESVSVVSRHGRIPALVIFRLFKSGSSAGLNCG